MKTIYKSIIFASVISSLTIGANAQNTSAKADSTLNRQILLERDFDPTLQDASKINTLPAVHEPVIKQANIQYESRQPGLSFNNYPLGDTGSGDIKTNINYSKKRGYLDLGAGTYSNILGNLGYKIVDTKADQFDVFARYNSTNGNIKYADQNYDIDKQKAKYSDILIKARYQHSFEFLKWYLDAKYQNTGFNYYGNSFGNYPDGTFDYSKKQSLNNFGIETGVKSNNNNEFIYTGSLAFNHFSTKYGPSASLDGISGNLINANIDIAAPFNSDKLIGVRLGILNEGFSDVDYYTKEENNKYLHSLIKLRFNPYIGFEGANYKISLGVNVNYAIDKKNKFLISPDINIDWRVAESTSLYITAVGGINDNNFLSVMRENRYVYLGNKVDYSQTLVDGSIGIKSGAIKGFEFDIFGGYKYTKNEHLYNTLVNSFTLSWSNVFIPDYVDLGVGHFGGQIKTNLIPRTELSAKAVGYFYNVSKKGDGYGKLEALQLPSFTVGLNADIHILDNLLLSAKYTLATGRKASLINTYDAGGGIPGLSYTEVGKIKNINELSIGAEYKITDWITAFAQVNNVLNQKYDSWYGYTQQGLNVMGGLRFKF